LSLSNLISGSTASLEILPLDDGSQVVSGFVPLASTFGMTDDQGGAYAIQSLVWDPTTFKGLMTFTVPVLAPGAVALRNLTITYKGAAITEAPTPLQVNLIPSFQGHSVLTNALLAWDMTVPNATTSSLQDFSGNSNSAVNPAGGYFQPAVLSAGSNGTSGSLIFTSETASFPLTRDVLSGTWPGGGASTASFTPILNPASLAADTFSTWPIQTISTVFYKSSTPYAGMFVPVNLWSYSFTGSNNINLTYTLTFDGNSTLNLTMVYGPNGATGTLISAPVGNLLDNNGRIGLITLVFNPDGTTSLYINASLVGTGAWPDSPSFNLIGDLPPQSGNNVLVSFEGLGAGNIASCGDTVPSATYGQLELIAYSDAKTAAFIATNASAWGLV